MHKEIFVETLYPPNSLFQEWPVPFTGITIPKYFIESGWTTLIGLQPLTAYYRHPDGKIRYLASAILRYPHSKENRTLSIHRLSVIVDEPETQQEIVKRFLEECEHQAHRIGAEALEAEVYIKSNGLISFPSGSYYLDEYNDENIVNFYLENGFHTEKKKYCLQKSLREKHTYDTKNIREIKNTEKDRIQYHNLINKGVNLIEHNSDIFFGFDDLLKRNVCYLSDKRTMLVSEAGTIFKQLNGVINWSPNIYPYYLLEGKKILYQNLDEIMNNPDLIKIGKIFNLMVKENKVEQYSNLCYAAINKITDFKLDICQVGEISENESDFLRFLYDEKFKIVHSLVTMMKKI